MNNKTNLYIIIAAVVILAFVGIWLRQTQKPVAPPVEINQPVNNQAPEAPLKDTTSSINKELEGINVNDLDKEFQSIDADLKNL